MKHKKAFTLIELLVAISIFSVVAISVYYAFSSGIAAWRRLNVATSAHQNIRIGLELLGEKIANMIPSDKVKLEGEKSKIVFLGILDKAGLQVPGKISFFLDEPAKTAKTIMQAQEDLQEEFLSDVSGLEFKYYCKAGSAGNEYEWLDFIDPNTDPACSAVSISITSGVTFTKIVPLYAQNQKNVQPAP